MQDPRTCFPDHPSERKLSLTPSFDVTSHIIRFRRQSVELYTGKDYDRRTQVAALGFMVLGTLQFRVTVQGSLFSLLTRVLSVEAAAPQTSTN